MRSAHFLLVAATFVPLVATRADGPTTPFYAMDTNTKRPYPKNDIPPAAQFDLLKELGYAGIAWTEEPAAAVRAAVADCEARGLKMFAIYCGATVTPGGGLTASPLTAPILEALDGHDTLVWIHIGGKGPAISSLDEKSRVIDDLRALADAASRHHLRIAIYPHVGEWTEHLADAVAVARLVDRPNFGVTFNLCHALALGDEPRIPELLRDAGPLLFGVTINGADSGVTGAKWDRLIQPLDSGTYRTADLLRALDAVGYRGPIGLQGYGIPGDRRENLERSIAAWKRLP